MLSEYLVAQCINSRKALGSNLHLKPTLHTIDWSMTCLQSGVQLAEGTTAPGKRSVLPSVSLLPCPESFAVNVILVTTQVLEVSMWILSMCCTQGKEYSDSSSRLSPTGCLFCCVLGHCLRILPGVKGVSSRGVRLGQKVMLCAFIVAYNHQCPCIASCIMYVDVMTHCHHVPIDSAQVKYKS